MAAVVPPGQQGEGQGLPLAVGDAQLLQGPHRKTAATAAKLLHQHAVAAAATGHQHLQGPWLEVEIRSHHRRREGAEGGEGIGGEAVVRSEGSQLPQAPLQVRAPEAFPPRGLRGGLPEVGLLEPSGDQRLVDCSLPGPGAVGIEAEAAAAELAHGQIQQGVGWAAVPAAHRRVPIRAAGRWQQGEVGDAPQVQHRPPATDAPQQGSVGGRHEGSPLAAEGEVGAAEIEDHRLVEQLREQGTLKQLPACSPPARSWGAVPDGLAVAAHQFRLPVGIAGPGGFGLLFGEGLG